MDKYTKAVLTMIALCVLTLPVKAEEKVWYCEMTESIRIEDGSLIKIELTKFKMKVTASEVVFGSGGYFGNQIFPIVWSGGPRMFEANHPEVLGVNLAFKEGAFYFSMVDFDKVMAISAQCDDF